MATSGTHGLQRQSISSKRARRTIETIETVIGRTIGSDPSDYTSGQEAPSEQQLEFNFRGSVDETDKR
jgi:hypothetical protein